MEKKVSKILKEIQPSRREQLKAQKIEQVKLGTIDEIESIKDDFERAYMDAAYLASEAEDEYTDLIEQYRSEIGRIDDIVINGTAVDLLEYSTDLQEKLMEVERTADELGIDPADFIGDFEELKRMANDAEGVYNEARTAYSNIVQYSGFLNNFWR